MIILQTLQLKLISIFYLTFIDLITDQPSHSATIPYILIHFKLFKLFTLWPINHCMLLARLDQVSPQRSKSEHIMTNPKIIRVIEAPYQC